MRFIAGVLHKLRGYLRLNLLPKRELLAVIGLALPLSPVANRLSSEPSMPCFRHITLQSGSYPMVCSITDVPCPERPRHIPSSRPRRICPGSKTDSEPLATV